MITHLSHKNIDKTKWDNCISKCANSSPTLYFDYLDIICKRQWDAIVYLSDLGDYRAVLPMPHKSRMFLFQYVYHPPYIQKLGLYTFEADFEVQAQAMWDMAFRSKSYFHFQISTRHRPTHTEILCNERKNYLLDLNREYADIFQKYSSIQKKKLASFKKKEDLFTIKTISATEAFEFIKKNNNYPSERNKYTDIEQQILHYITLDHGQILQLSSTDTTHAILVVLEDKQRAVNLINVSSAEGYKVDAMAVLIDYYIQHNAGKKKYFDFEGSMIEGVANFFKTFSPDEEIYLKIKK